MNGPTVELLKTISRYVSLQFHAKPSANTPNYTPPPSGNGGTSTLAVVTLICGILSWTLVPLIAGFIGVVTGWVELGNIKKGTSSADGKIMTQIGFGLSLASVLLTCVGTCAAVAIYFGVFAMIFGTAAVGAAAG